MRRYSQGRKRKLGTTVLLMHALSLWGWRRFKMRWKGLAYPFLHAESDEKKKTKLHAWLWEEEEESCRMN
jgi:hypothetical protein